MATCQDKDSRKRCRNPSNYSLFVTSKCGFFIFCFQPCSSSKWICSVKFCMHTAREQPYKLPFLMRFSNQSVSCNLCFSLLEWKFHYMNLKICAASSKVWQKSVWGFLQYCWRTTLSRTNRVQAGPCHLLGRFGSELSTEVPSCFHVNRASWFPSKENWRAR